MSDVRVVAVATDRSEGGDRAVEWATQLASSSGGRLVAIQVVVAMGDDDVDHLDLRRSLAESLRSTGPPAEAVVVTASPDRIAETIVDEAARAGADLLVVGNSGMRGRKEFLLGNVANRVTHLASCSVVIANSTDGLDTEPADDEAEALGQRAQEIGRVLGPVLLRQLGGRVLGVGGTDDGPRELRLALEQLGPTFGKLGQILSTRPDLVPQAYIDELSSLQSDVPPLREDEVVRVMEQELGVPWEDVFGSIEPEPLAAGTIGQVHRATLADGRAIVVKVQRPTAASLIEQDLTLLDKLVAQVGRSRRATRVIDLPSVVEQLGTALRAELDFLEEAANLEQMGKALDRYPNLAVPECHLDLSTRRLLVMDQIDGVPVLDAPESPARSAAARQLLQSFYQQVLEDGFFHADPHPGNLMWGDDCIWLLDLGMVGRLDGETRRHLTLMLLAFAQGDVGMLADISLVMSGGDTSRLDLASYEHALGEIVERLAGQTLQDLQLVDVLNDLTELSVRHGVPLPSSLVMVGKALAQVQLTVSELEPTIDPMDEASRFFVSSITRRLAARLDPQQMAYEVEKLRFRFDQIGEALATVSGSRPGRKLEVGFTSTRLEETVVRAGRSVALGLSAGLAWVAVSVASSSDHIDPKVKRGIQGLAGGLTAALAASLIKRT
jgi:predicted unusual protein kinase regulating ubiquinone biosynthesis (AarF/ABC1/UbiB family)/nucleotide-binding universal stress UspA family protein